MFYTTFIIDVFSRAIVGSKESTRMTIDMVVNALAKTVNGSYKIAMIKYFKSRLARFSRCTNATLNQIDWFNIKHVNSYIRLFTVFWILPHVNDEIKPLNKVNQLE